ncbi:MAG TPA: ATPase domain-containing protein [Thermoplasmata archaeon]|nr:ATPase domain-containing protein [Thermoplasmata archaeon]
MAGEGVVAHPAEARVSTGNPSLDAMLEGGLVAHRPYLIVGPSGTGKTTLGIQFLCEGVRRNERVLLVTLEEPPNEARANHRGLEPTLDRVEVFDAIPDIMRYERTPFKDIASVRTAIPFAHVPPRIRQSPELASVEVTITALEQMLRTEVIRKGYTRLVIDSLTALQYFCMKGFDPVGGAQSLLRFLSDLRVTTLITVEAPLEDVETPERMLARGEIRLFRWELDGQTVRAVGVEKFRGSSHDVRLHPYRIGPQGIDINLDMTISRDTRQIIEPIVPRVAVTVATAPPAPVASPVTPLMDELRDLILIGADVGPARSEIAAALAATIDGRPDQAQAHLSRVSSLVIGLVDQLSRAYATAGTTDPVVQASLQRLLARADSVRAGVPPTSLPPASALQVQLGALLSLLPVPAVAQPPLMPAPAPVAPPEAALIPPAPAVAPPEPEATPSEPAPARPVEVVTPPVLVAPPSPAETPQPVEPEPSKVEKPAPAPSPPPVVETPVPTSVPEVVPEAVAGTSEIPVPSAPPPPAEPILIPRPPPAGAPPPPPGPEQLPTARVARRLPAPPKPHPPIGRGPSRPTQEPTSRPRTAKAGPPPLPSTATPAWLAAPAVPAKSTVSAHAAARVPEAHVPAPPTPGRATATAAAKKRRRGAVTPGAKRPAGHAKPAASHEAEVKSVPAPELVTPPTLPAAPVSAAEPSAALTTKVRRRAPRKRKAPPVVSATVEPVPPGALMEPPEPSKTPDDPDAPSPPEG